MCVILLFMYKFFFSGRAGIVGAKHLIRAGYSNVCIVVAY